MRNVNLEAIFKKNSPPVSREDVEFYSGSSEFYIDLVSPNTKGDIGSSTGWRVQWHKV